MPPRPRLTVRLNWFFGRLRFKVIAALAVLLALAALLLWWAVGIPQYGQNLALNVGADLVGAVVTIFVISPLITRAQHGRVREHRRLDYDLFTEQVARSTTDVRILDTFSNLFDRPGTARFFRAVREAMARQVHVRVLLLHPDSMAAAQRASELDDGPAHPDLRVQIVRNLRVLDRFARDLNEQIAHRFEVRLYAVSASVTLYRCDDWVLVSFLPIGRLSSDGTQLEIATGSPLGTFVGERFEELWRHGEEINSFLRVRVEMTGSDTPPRTFTCDYVTFNTLLHIAEPQILAHIAIARETSFYAIVPGQTRQYRLEVVAPEEQDTLSMLYVEKYEQAGHPFVRLTPTADDSRTIVNA
jgi:hypothetical protein